MTTAERINWKPILLEAFFVVFGVFLALLANAWWEDRRAVREADELLEAVRAETQRNAALVGDAVAYHGELVGKLQRALAAGQTLPADAFPRGFLSQGEPLSSAWATAVEANAVPNMPVAAVLQLSETYERQERYRDQRQIIGDIIYRQMFLSGPEALTGRPASHLTLIYNSMYLECGLLDHYARTLEVLGTEPSAVPASCQRFLSRPD